MFDPTSRYANLPIRHHSVEGGGEGDARAHVARRFIPPPERTPTVSTVVVRAADRVDHLAAAAYGDPTQFWRIADHNLVADADELTATVGRRLAVPAITPPPSGEDGPS